MAEKQFDLLVKGGRVLDPGLRLDGDLDVAVSGSMIVEVAANLDPNAAAEVVDARGRIVTPGLIDYHAHCYWGATQISINADVVGSRSGVTTWVDTGSAGAANFPGFYHHVIKTAKVDIIPFLNISWIGCAPFGDIFVPFNELLDPRLLDSEKAIAVCEQYEGVIHGIKLRASSDVCGAHGMTALRIARFVADAMRLPLMIHLSMPPLTVDDILPVLREGDTFTHCFTPFKVGVLDRDGNVREIVRDAKERGVIFDIGHGRGSFSFPVCEAAMGQGIVPDTISTDLSLVSINGPAYDLPTVMSKFLALGMTLEDVLYKTTARPAEILGVADRVGGLRTGMSADIAVLDIVERPVAHVDTRGNIRAGDRMIRASHTIKNGKILEEFPDPIDERPVGHRRVG